MDIPVAGYGESAMHLACMLGARFGYARPPEALVEAARLGYGLDRAPLLKD